MSAERLHSPEQMIGKSILEVICLLPTFPWYVEDLGRHVEVKICRLCFVDYDTWRPRNQADLYGHLSVKQGTPIKMEEILEMVKQKKGRTPDLPLLFSLMMMNLGRSAQLMILVLCLRH